MLKLYNPYIVFFMETKLNNRKMKIVHRRCSYLNGFEVSTEGSQGGLRMAWKGNISIFLRSYSVHHIDIEV